MTIFDPAAMQVVIAAPLLEKRGNAQLVALPGGQLLLVGGRSYVDAQAVVRLFLSLLLFMVSDHG